MLDAHQLNVFLVAAETLNFTVAAQRLHMSQPSVSQHINALERHFDTSLFLRSGRTVQLTDEGMALIPLARELVKQSILTEETMSSLRGEIHGQLQVSCSTTPGKYVLPQILASFHNRHPKVKVSCIVSPQSTSVDMLCNGEVHFALVSLGQDSCSEAEFVHFMCDPIVLIAPLDHEWTASGEIQPEELKSANMIMREETSGTQEAVHQTLLEAGISTFDLHTVLTLGNSEAIALSVQKGLGIGFVSTTVLKVIGEGRVAPIKIAGLDICRNIYIGRQKRYPVTIAQSAFWDFVASYPMPLNSQEFISKDDPD